MITGSHRYECLAEFVGTFILVFFGIGAVHTAVLSGAQAGLWQVAIVWGVALSVAIYSIGSISGAHLNPAITLALVVFRRFPVVKIPGYVVCQLAGAIIAAALLYALFHGALAEFEFANGLERGLPGSELSAMVYGEYFPNPAVAKAMGWNNATFSTWQAMLAEIIGTAFLAFFIFSLTDPRNTGRPSAKLVPAFIGLSLAIIISIIAPLTQSCLNPARDFGPRLVALAAGWGEIAIPGPRGGFFTVYILAPCIGALVGGAAYRLLVHHRTETNA